MALLPISIGVLFHPQWIHVLLVLAWFSGFHMFNAASLLAKARSHPRRRRYVPATLFWSALTAVWGLAFVVVYPGVLWWSMFFLPLIAVASFEVWAGQERAVLTRVATILTSALMLPLTVWVGMPGSESIRSSEAFFLSLSCTASGVSALKVWGTSIVLAAYFVGTVPYVRSLIRGRRNLGWTVGAGVFHAVVTLVVGVAYLAGYVSLLLVIVWCVLLLRSLFVPAWQRAGHQVRPATIGIGEFLSTGAVLAGALLSF